MQLTKEQVLNLLGNELDEAVALAQEWHKDDDAQAKGYKAWYNNENLSVNLVVTYKPSTDGSQCMEIMERESVNCYHQGLIMPPQWKACILNYTAYGETAMIAICRCFVLSKLDLINNARV